VESEKKKTGREGGEEKKKAFRPICVSAPSLLFSL
jgi:hypothetical protein